jgi:hypothetical protein
VTEHLVADPEPGHGCADGFDLAGQLDAERPPSRPAEPGEEAPEDRRSRPRVPIGLGDRAGADRDQDLVVLGHGPLDLFDSEDLRRPVAILDYGFHALTPYRVTVVQ